MNKRKATSADYEVGYGKPPKKTQFQAGRSGNPAGRPKGRSNFGTILENQLYKMTKVRAGGDVLNVNVLEAVVMRLNRELLHGNLDNALAILKFIRPWLEPIRQGPSVLDLAQISDEDLDQMIRLTEKYGSFRIQPVVNS